MEDPVMWTRGKTIGRGYYGFVSLATTTQNLDVPSTIAVKSAEFSRSKSLQKERELLNEFLDSDHVIGCFGADVTEENGEILYNILMEYASGGSLADCIGQRSGQGLPEYDVKRHAISVLLGLSDVHSRGIVHGDIKPQNVLISGSEGIAKIADFGFARKVGTKLGKRKRGALKGTLMYMAPESVLEEEYGPEADIWAFGCCVFEMITGNTIWDGSMFEETIDLLIEIGTESPNLQDKKESKEAEDFIRMCLNRNPRLRWTANMLLKHPFLAVVHEETIKKMEMSPFYFQCEVFIDDFCNSTEMDELKPMLLLNKCESNKRRRKQSKDVDYILDFLLE